MKIALVHDYIKEYGGAERVLEALHELYPDAPVYTSVYLPEFLGPHAERFKSWNIRESWAKYIPFKEKLISPLRLLSPFLFQSFDLSQYDVVIVSATGAYASNSIRRNSKFETLNSKKVPVRICYCHTPPRYLYGYETAREWKKNPVLRVVGEFANFVLRIVDFQSSQQVDFFIANSQEVARRIKKFYRRESVVIYPPVDTGFTVQTSPFTENNKKTVNHGQRSTSYCLAGGRLARPKHIDLIVRACAQGKIPLKVFGRGFAGYEEEILNQVQNDSSRLRSNNIEFVGEVSEEEKYELMKNAKAYLFAAADEDFGITPVEAMSYGTPVIAYKGGGVLETVIDGKTGVFFDELTEKSLLEAIKKLEKLKIIAEDCKKQGQKFSKERFKTQIQMFVESHR